MTIKLTLEFGTINEMREFLDKRVAPETAAPTTEPATQPEGTDSAPVAQSEVAAPAKRKAAADPATRRGPGARPLASQQRTLSELQAERDRAAQVQAEDRTLRGHANLLSATAILLGSALAIALAVVLLRSRRASREASS